MATTRNILHVIVTLLAWVVCTNGADGWTTPWGSEFEFFTDRSYGEYRNWYDARTRCRDMGADLAPLGDVTDLHKYVSNIFGSDSDHFWVGVDLLLSNDWKFTVTQERVTDQSLWDEAHDYPSDEEKNRCAYITPTTKGRWRNNNCGVNAWYICQRRVISGTEAPPTAPPIPPTVTPQGECPYGFRGIGDKCYRIFTHSPKTWDGALDACARLTSGNWPSLASFRNETEYAVLLMMLGDQPEISAPLWFGLYAGSSPLAAYPWFWADNSLYDSTQSKFAILTGSGCAYVSPSSPAYWFPKLCDTPMGYVCQTYKDGSTTAAPPSTSTCPPEYVSYGDGCYKLHPEEQSWSEADAICRGEARNSTLVSIHSATENAVVLVVMSTDVPSAWIGLKKDTETGNYVWSDGSVVTYSHWGFHQSQNCSGISNDGKWWSDSCDQLLPFVCKVPLGPLPTMPPHKEGSCPHSDGVDWVKHGEHCYQFHHVVSGSSSFPDALKRCTLSHSGGHLVTVHSKEENDFLYRFFLENSGSGNVWLGMYKNNEGGFDWVESEAAIEYTNWFHGEPSEGKDCAVLNTAHGHEKQWMSSYCSSYLNFVCKVDVGPQVEPPPEVPGFCPDEEWLSYGSHCYLFQPEAQEKWPTARAQCLEHQADLVTIEDRAENEFVAERAFEAQTQVVKRYYWIGLTKPYDGSPYIWVDDHFLSNTTVFWDEGVARLEEASYVRAQSSKGLWYADPMGETGLHGYVCKLAKGAQSQTTTSPDAAGAPSGSGLSGGEVAGVVIGVLVLLALVLVGILALVKYRERLFPAGFGQERLENED